MLIMLGNRVMMERNYRIEVQEVCSVLDHVIFCIRICKNKSGPYSISCYQNDNNGEITTTQVPVLRLQ